MQGYSIGLKLEIGRRFSKQEKVHKREEGKRSRRAQRPGQSFVRDPWVVKR